MDIEENLTLTSFQSVLVETQDKALRRISELREQCSLEQQAKAHLESALRLDMDEQDCVIKTLKTKLALLGENPDEVLKNGKDNLINLETNGLDQLMDSHNNLINISDDNQHDSSHMIAAGASIIINESDEKIRNLEGQLVKFKELIAEEKSKLIIKNEEFSELNKKFDESQRRVRELIAREEDNNILLAENKLMIHTELENKEKEAKSAKQRLSQVESELKQIVGEKDNLNKALLKYKQEEGKSSAKIKDLADEKKRLDQRVSDLEKAKSNLENDIKELQAKSIVSESEKQTVLAKNQAELEKARGLAAELQKKISELEVESKGQTQDRVDKLEAELKHVKSAHAEISKSFSEAQANNQKQKETADRQTETIAKVAADLEQSDKDKVHLEQSLEEKKTQISVLSAEKENQLEVATKVFNEEKDKCRILQESIQNNSEEVTKLTASVEALQGEKCRLEESLKDLEERLKALSEEKDSLATELDASKSQSGTLKTENNDLNLRIGSLSEEIKNIKVKFISNFIHPYP